MLCSDGSEELYDHTNDPNEWTNKANNISYAGTKAILRKRLFEALGFKNATSLVVNGGLENNINNWQPWGGSVNLESSTAEAYEQGNSVLVSNRDAPWQGLKQDLLTVLEAGKTYHFSVWVKLANSSEATVRLGIRQTIGENPTAYPSLASITASNSAFRLIEGDYTVPNNQALTTLYLTINGSESGVNFYVDHVQVYAYQETLIIASVVVDDNDRNRSLTWNAELGSSYRVEHSLTLERNDWTVQERAIIADKTQMEWLITPSQTQPRSFWRVIKNPPQ